ncbi:ImmA/IrrE family metallo-endopeptidase [Acetobacterium woodii]|nr:ImmA/IrrE family metallo-endopeptidase [Acetobacterium woodii]
MFKYIKKCALKTLQSNNISEFPIPIYAIEQIIIDHYFDIVIIPTLRKSCVFDQTLFVANLPDTEFRISLAHELGHILMHDFFIHSSRFEAQANAFAAYFLMPPSMFEGDLKQLNEWDLAEKYGVPVESIIKRAALITELSNKEMRIF